VERLVQRDSSGVAEQRLKLARSMPSEQPGTPLALLLPG
jgi:hypothetical protein